MPMSYVLPDRGKDPICYEFWIKSSRGTDVKHEAAVPDRNTGDWKESKEGVF